MDDYWASQEMDGKDKGNWGVGELEKHFSECNFW